MRGLESRGIVSKIKAISYIGSKDRLNTIVSNNLPSNIKTYCEPFSGGFSLALNLINEDYLKGCKVVYNDLDTYLATYFKCLKENTMLLVDSLIDVMDEVTEAHFKEGNTIKSTVQELRTKYEEENNVYMQSALYYWIKKSNRGGYADYVAIHEYVNVLYLSNMLTEVSKILQRVDICNKNYADLKYLDSEETFWYLDPPYVGYNNETFYSQCLRDGEFNHIALRDFLKDVKGKFILSYNDCKEIRELYSEFNIYPINMRSFLGLTGQTSELLISNYVLSVESDKVQGVCGILEFKGRGNKNSLDSENTNYFDMTLEELLLE